jgi:dihydrodiol dehydrogenase / D-xylose 1-dehydrogenase (NADP)
MIGLIVWLLVDGGKLMADRIRWGILGAGYIANAFATGLQALSDAELVAVGSREAEKAEAFGAKYHIPHRHTGYDALVDDPDVDAIYVSTPHPFHHPHTVLALQAGKAVLCEKPFAMNEDEASDMIALARLHKLFLMEAMWTRFLPVMVKIRELIAGGAIGEPRMVTADFGFRTDFNPQGRLFAPELGGGALLDVGIYPISLAFMLFGKPAHIASQADLGQTGVDEQSAVLFRYDGGQLALLSSATRTNTPQEAVIAGTEGSIRIHSPWWNGRKFTLTKNGEDEVFAPPTEGNGYNYEAAEVGHCLRAGKLESDVLPLEESRVIMETLDAIRAQWGLKYPGEG